MAQRIFGPIRAAGVQIEEKEGDKPITPGALGQVGYAGLFEKGEVGKLIYCQGKNAFTRKMGGLIADGQAPDACQNYADLAAGAGGMWLVRVTDGNELKSEITLYAKRPVLTPMGKLVAKNGGRWGGKAYNFTSEFTGVGDLTEITLTTGFTGWKTDQLKGGSLVFAGIANKSYAIVGNDAAGVITVSADQKMLTDFGAGTDFRFYVAIANEGKALSVLVEDGEEKPTTEFAVSVYVDGAFVKKWANLSIDPASPRYWVAKINEDGDNFEGTAVDLWTGAPTADVRPASHYGVSSAVTATVLTAVTENHETVSPGGAVPTLAMGTTTDEMLPQKVTCTVLAGDLTFSAVSDKHGALGTGTLGTAFAPTMKWAPPFMLDNGTGTLVEDDVVTIWYKPFAPSSLVGGSCFPDKANAPRVKFRIVANDHKSVTVADGSDMTDDGAPGDQFQIDAKVELAGGRDGHADITDAHYNQQAWDVGSSPFNRLRGKNVGLVKFATPGVTSTSVQKAGLAYAAAKNHQYRYEVPANVTDEVSADGYVNDTLGRSDYAVVSWPSYGYVNDPASGTENRQKLCTLTGRIHGREAAICRNYQGYHKAEAGVDAVLTGVLDIPTGDRLLDEEMLNPRGINVVKKVQGNFVSWGDRTLWTDPNWKWKHQREQMSYYEQVFIEAFDWIVFQINSTDTQGLGLTSLKSFFLPEWRKGAIRGKTLDEAAIIKIDAENNTDATMADGDMFADISLRLADTVERFRIRIGKQGIFEAAA